MIVFLLIENVYLKRVPIASPLHTLERGNYFQLLYTVYIRKLNLLII